MVSELLSASIEMETAAELLSTSMETETATDKTSDQSTSQHTDFIAPSPSPPMHKVTTAPKKMKSVYVSARIKGKDKGTHIKISL